MRFIEQGSVFQASAGRLAAGMATPSSSRWSALQCIMLVLAGYPYADRGSSVGRQADSYDRRLLETRGVSTIWNEDHGDVPITLRAVAGVAR